MPHTQTPPRSAKTFVLFISGLAAIFAVIAHQYVQRYQIPTASAIAIYLCFLLALILALAPAVAAVRSVIYALFPGRKRFVFIAIFLSPYVIYAAGTNDFRWFALLRLIAIAAPAPLLYLRFPVRHPSTFAWQDALLGAWMLVAVLFHGLSGIFTLPANGHFINPHFINPHFINLDFLTRLFLIAVASWTWTFLRPVPGLGYQFVLSKQVAVAATVNFAFFSLIALPLGIALHFIAWNPHWHGPAAFALDYLEIFLFIALLEELFFRGFLQNLLSRTFRHTWTGQLLASILFGLTHVLHAPVPNWRYVALASVAGWFYGSAYRATGTIFASAVTHALVDTAWRTFFTRT